MKDVRVIARMWSPYTKMNGYYSTVADGSYVSATSMARTFFPDEAVAFFRDCRNAKPARVLEPIAVVLVPVAEAKDLDIDDMRAPPAGHSIWPEKDFGP